MTALPEGFVRLFALAVFLLAMVIGLSVFAAGGTFGQRCAKAYPNSPMQQEECVDRVSHGGKVYRPTQQEPNHDQ